jgi:hypothetical protein
VPACIIDGKIGKEAKQLWSKYDHERPDYTTYIKRMKDREKADIKAQKEMTKELDKLDKELIDNTLIHSK